MSNEVIADLGLSRQQVNAIMSYGEHSDRYTNGADSIAACNRDRAGIFSHLTDQQKLRYQQLTIQSRGAMLNFLIPGIVAELKLTPEQERQLEELYAIYGQGVKNLNAYEMASLQSAYAQGKFSRPLKKAVNQIAESILTVEQHMHWKTLQGPIIDPLPDGW